MPTGKYYVGIHSTNRLDDRYMGSGKILKDSRKKYGDYCHIFEVLKRCNSRDELLQLEKSSITQEMIQDERCMNLSYGGEGGSSGRSIETRLKISQSRTGKKQRGWSLESRMKLSNARKGWQWSDADREKISKGKVGIKMADDVKQKISDTLKKKHEARNNGV